MTAICLPIVPRNGKGAPHIARSHGEQSSERAGFPKASAQATLEYAMLLGLVSLGSMAGLSLLLERINALYAGIAAQLAAIPIP
jgi:Flp pilus assembly pilin Flp